MRAYVVNKGANSRFAGHVGGDEAHPFVKTRSLLPTRPVLIHNDHSPAICSETSGDARSDTGGASRDQPHSALTLAPHGFTLATAGDLANRHALASGCPITTAGAPANRRLSARKVVDPRAVIGLAARGIVWRLARHHNVVDMALA
jgi:hypothetical protein